jgi:type I restriction enzyme S subunit
MTTAVVQDCPADSLRDGWRWASLGELADFVNGAAFKPTDWTGEGRPIIRIQNLTNPAARINRTTRVVPDKYAVEPGDLLVSWSATLDAFIWKGESAWLNQHIFLVKPNGAVVEPRYLYYLLKHEIEALKKSEHLHGSTMLHINRKPFLSHRFPFPSCLETQRRIVARIDELLSELDDGEDELRRARAELETYRKSLLKAAVTGELTADWRAANPPKDTGADHLQRILADRRARWEADPRNRGKLYKNPVGPISADVPQVPVGWAIASIEQVTSDALIGLDRGRSQQSPNPADGVAYVKMNNVTMSGAVDLSKLVYVPASPSESEKFSLRRGDILFNTRNSLELVGKSGMVGALDGPAIFNNNLMRLRTAEAMLPDFLARQMQSVTFWRQLERAKRATTSVAAIYAGSLMSCWVAVPPPAEQEAIVLRLSEIEPPEIDGEYGEQVALLRQSILAAAFRGELVQ